jgi:mono/diheme cytochrome c family protein
MATAMSVAGCSPSERPSSTAPGSTPVALATLDPNQVARGRQIYLESCGSCHGQNAEGAPNWQRPDERGNLPAPPHDDSGHTWRHGDAQLVEIIRNGMRDPFNKTPELTMPPFEDRLSDDEVRAVITYFKSLWSAEHRRFQEQESRRPPLPSPGSGR